MRVFTRSSLYFILLLALAAAIGVFTPTSRAETQVVRGEALVAASSFSFDIDGQPTVIQAGAVRDTRTTSPPTAIEVSTRAFVTFQRYNPETGEQYNWSCDTPIDSASFEFGTRWSAELHAVLTCSDGVVEFPASVDLVVDANGPVTNYPVTNASERLGEASLSVTANGTTYNLVSGEDRANITQYSVLDPVRTDRVVLVSEGTVYHEDVAEVACLDITDLYAIADSAATNVVAAVTLDASGTYHLRADGTIGYSILGADGALYQATATVRIHEAADLELDEFGSASVPFEIPVTLTAADGPPAEFVIEGTIGVGAGNHAAFGVVAAHCA